MRGKTRSDVIVSARSQGRTKPQPRAQGSRAKLNPKHVSGRNWHEFLAQAKGSSCLGVQFSEAGWTELNASMFGQTAGVQPDSQRAQGRSSSPYSPSSD